MKIVAQGKPSALGISISLAKVKQRTVLQTVKCILHCSSPFPLLKGSTGPGGKQPGSHQTVPLTTCAVLETACLWASLATFVK